MNHHCVHLISCQYSYCEERSMVHRVRGFKDRKFMIRFEKKSFLVQQS